MNAKTKFIFKEILWANSFLVVLILCFGVVDYFFIGDFLMMDIPWILVVFIAADIIGFFYNLKRLKTLGINIALTENQHGSLTKTITVQLPKEKILDLLKQNVWKFKTESKTEVENRMHIQMKYYRLFWNEKFEILVTEINMNECTVKLTAGYKDDKPWLLSVHSSWARSIQHIKYFENALLSREELHQELNFIQ